MAVDNKECLVFGINQTNRNIIPLESYCVPPFLFYDLLRTKFGIDLTQTKGRLFRDTSF